jgi:hypothetical protein
VGRGGCQHRRQPLVNCDHGGSITSHCMRYLQVVGVAEAGAPLGAGAELAEGRAAVLDGGGPRVSVERQLSVS